MFFIGMKTQRVGGEEVFLRGLRNLVGFVRFNDVSHFGMSDGMKSLIAFSCLRFVTMMVLICIMYDASYFRGRDGYVASACMRACLCVCLDPFVRNLTTHMR